MTESNLNELSNTALLNILEIILLGQNQTIYSNQEFIRLHEEVLKRMNHD